MSEKVGKSIIILGSSRSEGATFKILKDIASPREIPIIDLNKLNISPYDYEHKNINDDYLPLMSGIVKEYDTIILATPVYWYSMSARMKIFIDRLSDLLEVDKGTGRGLRGKKLLVIGVFNSSIPRGFEDPFSQTCEYLGIEYKGCALIGTGTKKDWGAVNEKSYALVREVLGGSPKF